MRYGIAYGDSPPALKTSVESMIASGFEPQGGICVTVGRFDDEERRDYYQAMVKPNRASA